MKPDWISSFSFLNSFCLKPLMLWTRVRNLPLGPSSLGFFTCCLYPGSRQTSRPAYHRLYFFNPCFPQCIPVRHMSCKRGCLRSSYPPQARTCGKETCLGQECIKCLLLAFPLGAVCCAEDFPPALPVPAFQLGAFSHRDMVSEVPSSLFRHSGKENG